MDNSTTYNKVDEREIKQKHLQHSPTLYNLAIPQFINSPSSVPDSATLSTSQYNDLQAQKDFLNPFYTSRQSHNSNGAKKPDNKQFIDTLTSTVGALLVTIILYPLENIRTRVSVSQLRVNYVKSIAEIVNSEGFYGLYRGLTSSLIGVLLSWGIYHGSFIFLNSTIKSPYLGKGINYDSLPKIGAVFLSVLISTPVWVVNTRKTLDKSNSMSFWSDLKQIAHTERFISLFSGFIPSLLISLSPALNIFLLSRFKNILLRLKMITKKVKGLNKYNYSSILNSIYLKPEKGDKIKSHFTFKESFLIGMLSKLVISFLFYPFRLIKTILQSRKAQLKAYPCSVDVLTQIIENEGILGLFKGTSIKLSADILSTVLMLLSYRKLFAIFDSLYQIMHKRLKLKKRVLQNNQI